VTANPEAQLRALYAETESLLAGWSCDSSTDCCHFGRTGRDPWVSAAEWALLEPAIAARGAKKGPLLIVAGTEDRCPLLGRDGRCTVYAARPFGCRTYFCERARGPERRPPRDALAEIARRITALSEAADRTGDGPRPLRTWLANRARRSGDPKSPSQK
jgi:uncharacterized protein